MLTVIVADDEKIARRRLVRLIEETGEAVPVVQAITDLIGDRRFGGDARELLLEKDPKRQHEGPARLLAHCAALIGVAPADGRLDRIERGDAFEHFGGYRRVAALGDVEELAPQMRPAEGELNV